MPRRLARIFIFMKNNRTELIFALDLATREEALPLARALRSDLEWIKIGLQLFCRCGPSLVEELASLGYRIFLDLKLHDIPNTVAGSIGSLAKLPIEMLTLHASGGPAMLRAAVETRERIAPNLRLLGVTVLTSMDDQTLRSIGVDQKTENWVEALAGMATETGIDGLVCSPLEITSLRSGSSTKDLTLVVPGIRPVNTDQDEQQRVTTPAEAARAGADFIVVGRPISRAPNPLEAVRSIREELASVG